MPRTPQEPAGGAAGVVPVPRGGFGARKASGAATAKPQRRTGPTDAVVRATYARDGHLCVACGQPGSDWDPLVWHHRKNRAMGGSKNPAINQTSNGLTLHATENGVLEDSTRPEFYDQGLKLRDVRDALTTPVLYPDGCYYLLDDEGGRRSA